jgi:hypothetical protein
MPHPSATDTRSPPLGDEDDFVPARVIDEVAGEADRQPAWAGTEGLDPAGDFVIATEIVEDVAIVPEGPAEAGLSSASPAHRPNFVVRAWRAWCSAFEWSLGGMALVVGLAVLAAVPLLQLASLGYLLEVSGRIARTGRFTAGFIGFRKAARVGTMVLGTFALLLPLRFIAFEANAAELIAPGGTAARFWSAALVAATVLMVLHLMTAYWRGGKLRHFLLPANPFKLWKRWRQGGAYAEARDRAWRFIMGLRLPYYFWLGARGFVGGLVWLIVPVTLMAFGGKPPFPGPLGGLLAFGGSLMLATVLLFLPFLQARFAAQGRFLAMFEPWRVAGMFLRAPVAFWIALVFTLALALPLYLLKIELVPRDALGLTSFFFVVSILPARFLSGWACARANRRQRAGWWRTFLSAPTLILMLPAAGFYTFIVYFTQFTSWHGIWSLYEQHAFLLPVPFLGV